MNAKAWEFRLAEPRFLAADGHCQKDAVGLFGVPYDDTACFRKGACFGPSAIRHASDGLETYSPFLDASLEDFQLADLGDLVFDGGGPDNVVEQVFSLVSGLLSQGVRPLMLGGEHSPTTGAIQALFRRHPDLCVVQFDAHADLRQSYQGHLHSHACVMRRVLDFLPSERLLQVGIRSGTRVEFQEMRREKRLLPPHPEALKAALAPFARSPIYLTLDLDVFDPSVMPGTGTPEPGGITWHGFEALLGCLRPFRLVGADVMELAPDLDPTGCSAVLAAKVVRELALLLGR
jgi:agmatinase